MNLHSDSVQLLAMENDPGSQLLSSFSVQSGQLNTFHTFASMDAQKAESVGPNDGSHKVSGFSRFGHSTIEGVNTDNMTPSNQCSTTDSNLASHQTSEMTKQTIHKELWPKVITLERKQLSSTQKDTQHKPHNISSGNVRLQKSLSKNKRMSHAEPSPKVAVDSFESVRTKMRESLSAALTLVYKNQQLTEVDASGKSSNNNSQNLESAGAQESPSVDASSDVLLNNNEVIKDDLLSQNGLSWSSCIDVDECKEDSRETKRLKLASDIFNIEAANKSSQNLATEIEEELFNLFGGVNKKYKEKGRSLLFNLKDQNNPELRKHVFLGEVTPQRLCSMTVDELASKELSEWRIAKAEELAHMVVLPDLDVDLRRLVKKTHKGDVQVEFERDDRVSVEVAIGANILSRDQKEIPRKCLESSRSNGKEVEPKNCETKSSAALALSGTTFAEENSLESLLHDNTDSDFMQDIMVTEYKDSESLPPVPTLDEFMRDLDSQPPFENLDVDAFQENGLSGNNLDSLKTKLDAEMYSAHLKTGFSESTTVSKSIHIMDHADSPPNDKSAIMVVPKIDQKIVVSQKSLVPTKSPLFDSSGSDTLPGTSFGWEASVKTKLSARRVAHVWDGLIQLTVSSLVTVLGFYKSGEQTSIIDWPSFLEIKGRVRLDAFEKFLQELNSSRSRGVMVLQFLWKEGSPESGRVKLNETIDSYIAEERVGFAEPMSGVELYFCPAHRKTFQLLMENLPKEHGNAFNLVDDGLLGIAIWKRPTTRTVQSNTKHAADETLVPRKTLNLDAGRFSGAFHRTNPTLPEEIVDDVPPGFGPAPAKGVDDLPEFKFAQSDVNQTNTSSRFSSSTMVGLEMPAEVWSPQSSPVRPDFPPRVWSPVTRPVVHKRLDLPPHVRPPPLSRPVESQSINHLRQLIQRYGQDESRKEPGTRSGRLLEDDEDDILEWQQNKPDPFQHQRPPYPQGPHMLNHQHASRGQFSRQYTDNKMRSGTHLRRR